MPDLIISTSANAHVHYPRCSWAWAAPSLPSSVLGGLRPACHVAALSRWMDRPQLSFWWPERAWRDTQTWHSGNGSAAVWCRCREDHSSRLCSVLCSCPIAIPGANPSHGHTDKCCLPTHWGSEPSTKSWGERRDRDVCHEKGN